MKTSIQTRLPFIRITHGASTSATSEEPATSSISQSRGSPLGVSGVSVRKAAGPTSASPATSASTQSPPVECKVLEGEAPARSEEEKVISVATTDSAAVFASNIDGSKSKSSSGFSFHEITGDLFTDETSSLAHCVSRCLAMGKGIAVTFKNKFGRVDVLRAQGKLVGDVAVLKDGTRYIYYLITKERFFHKPTYESLTNSLVRMKEHALEHGVKQISMPRIGCGLDGLLWPRVRNIIMDVFRATDISIKIYQL